MGEYQRVMKYLEHQNRPLSLVDIFNNLHKEVGKSALAKVLDRLVEDGKVVEKSYGKQKVYVYDQKHLHCLSDVELKSIDAQISQLEQKHASELKCLHNVESSLTAFTSALTTEEAKQQICDINKQIAENSRKIELLNSGSKNLSVDDQEKVLKERNINVQEWKKRKRLATDVLDSILEGYSKPKKALIEDVGIETDEDFGISVPQS